MRIRHLRWKKKKPQKNRTKDENSSMRTRNVRWTMMKNKQVTEQDETETYLRTSMEGEQKLSTWEEYDEEEPLEGYDKDEPFEENDDEGKWMTQFSYTTEDEENALFLAFMTGNVEDQKTWINTKMNLARATTDKETRRREEEIR